MINLNSYIVEKLHLNKDIKVPYILSPGEYIFSMSIRLWGKELEFRIYHPFKCIDFNEKEINYETDAGRDVKLQIFLNSNGYYEMKKGDGYVGVFLPVKEGLNLLEKYNDSKFTIKTELPKYFDSSDKELIEKNDINPYFSINVDIPNFIKEYKKIK